MKAVPLAVNAQRQYISCSVRATAGMASSTLPQALEDRSVVQPAPSTGVADTTQLQQHQNSGVPAFVLSRSQERNGGDARIAFDLEFADGSRGAAPGKLHTVSFSLFADEAGMTRMFEFAEESSWEQVPVPFPV